MHMPLAIMLLAYAVMVYFSERKAILLVVVP